MMKIPFLDLRKINNRYREEISRTVIDITDSGNYILGEIGRLFEKEFAAYTGSSYCVGVASGTDALFLSLKALELEKDSEVILSSNSYIAAALAVVYNKLQPVLVEPDIHTYNIAPEKIREKISKNTKAILVTHMYGRLCEMDKIMAIAKKHKLRVIEDCAQSHGAVMKSTRAGNFGDISAFSFYPTKNLGALGDAGAIVTNNRELATQVSKMRNYGFSEKDYAEIKGHNSRLDEIQAGVLKVKLKYLEIENLRRAQIAKRYLGGVKNPKLFLPATGTSNVWHLFVVRTSVRKELISHLASKGIESKIHYPLPFYKQEAFKELNKLVMPISDKIHNEVLSIPLHAALENKEVDHVIEALNSY